MPSLTNGSLSALTLSTLRVQGRGQAVRPGHPSGLLHWENSSMQCKPPAADSEMSSLSRCVPLGAGPPVWQWHDTPLHQWSPAFLDPGNGFLEDNLPPWVGPGSGAQRQSSGCNASWPATPPALHGGLTHTLTCFRSTCCAGCCSQP